MSEKELNEAAKYKEIMDQFKITLKLSKIGEHFLNFIIQCKKLNMHPKVMIDALKQMREDPNSKVTNRDALIPIICFSDWFDVPSEENFQNLQKSIGVKIDKIVEEQLKEMENAKKDE